jgi:hypothetical protein
VRKTGHDRRQFGSDMTAICHRTKALSATTLKIVSK